MGLIEIGSRLGASQLQPNEPKSGYALHNKSTVFNVKINQGVGWSFEGLGKEFRSREVLAPSKVIVKFRSQSEVLLPDNGAASLYTDKNQIPLMLGRAGPGRGGSYAGDSMIRRRTNGKLATIGIVLILLKQP